MLDCYFSNFTKTVIDLKSEFNTVLQSRGGEAWGSPEHDRAAAAVAALNYCSPFQYPGRVP